MKNFFLLLFFFIIIGLIRIIEVKGIIPMVPAYAEFYYDHGKELDQQGKTQEAIKAYEQALFHNKDHMMAQYRVGMSYGDVDQDDKKMTAFQRAADLGFQYDPDVFIALGQKDFAQDLYDEAIKNYSKAIKLIHIYRTEKERHSLSTANFYLGDVFFYQKDFNKAFEYYSRAISFDREWVEEQLDVLPTPALDTQKFWAQLYYNLGHTYHVQHEYLKARDIYLKAIALNDQFVQARADLGYVESKIGNMEALKEQIKKLEEMNEENAVRRLKSHLNESSR